MRIDSVFNKIQDVKKPRCRGGCPLYLGVFSTGRESYHSAAPLNLAGAKTSLSGRHAKRTGRGAGVKRQPRLILYAENLLKMPEFRQFNQYR